MKQLIKSPSAWIPIALSLVALGTMLLFIGIHGTPTRQLDEGTGAHLFQIWLVAEFLMIVYFAIKWLPRQPKATLTILALQIIAVLVACMPVAYLKL